MAYLIVFSESAKVTDDRYGKKNIIPPSLAGACQLTAQRLMVFWHASDDDIVAGGRRVPRDLPSPPRGQKLSGSDALALSLTLSLSVSPIQEGIGTRRGQSDR